MDKTKPMKTSLEKKLPKLISSKILIEKNGCQLQLDKLEQPDGHTYEYVTFVSGNRAVMILAETKEGKFVINKEYRHPTKKILLSLPGGYVEEGEEPIEGAPRELIEETGYQAEEFLYLGQAHPFPGRHCQETYYYLAKGARKIAEPTPDDCEIFQSFEYSLEELNQMLKESQNLDGHVATALYFKMLRSL